MSQSIVNALPVGTVLHGKSCEYVVRRVLGQGTFGITYLAKVRMQGALGNIDSNMLVAVKEFFMHDVNGREESTVTSGSKDGLFADYRRKFAREAHNLGKLQHPGIIKVLEAFEENNTSYYSMEYVDGGSLDDYIAACGSIAESDAVAMALQIGGALDFMHRNRMLHLDLKPANIMRRGDGSLVLIDFGLAKQYNSEGEPESSTTVGRGTAGYAPLEQVSYRDGHGFPVTMDVYALGATMFKMLTGQRPPEASSILNDGFPRQLLAAHGVSEELTAAVGKAMSPLLKDRFQSVAEFVAALSCLTSGRTQAHVSSPEPATCDEPVYEAVVDDEPVDEPSCHSETPREASDAPRGSDDASLRGTVQSLYNSVVEFFNYHADVIRLWEYTAVTFVSVCLIVFCSLVNKEQVYNEDISECFLDEDSVKGRAIEQKVKQFLNASDCFVDKANTNKGVATVELASSEKTGVFSYATGKWVISPEKFDGTFDFCDSYIAKRLYGLGSDRVLAYYDYDGQPSLFARFMSNFAFWFSLPPAILAALFYYVRKRRKR